MFWSVGLFPRVLALSPALSVSLSLSVFHVPLSQNFIRWDARLPDQDRWLDLTCISYRSIMLPPPYSCYLSTLPRCLSATASSVELQQHNSINANGWGRLMLWRCWRLHSDEGRMSNKAPEFGLVDENATIKKLCVLHTQGLARLCVSFLGWRQWSLCRKRARKQNIAELMFSLYCLASLCGTLNQIVWVSELGGLYKFIEGNSREAERAAGDIKKIILTWSTGACCIKCGRKQ